MNGYKKGAWEELALIYSVTKQDEKLKALIYSPESRSAVPPEYRYKFYFLSGDLLSFYKLRFETMAAELSFWGILGDILILLTWLFFLRTLSFLSPVKWRHFLVEDVIGDLLPMGSWLSYEF